jgi:hypothetical protein
MQLPHGTKFPRDQRQKAFQIKDVSYHRCQWERNRDKPSQPNCQRRDITTHGWDSASAPPLAGPHPRSACARMSLEKKNMDTDRIFELLQQQQAELAKGQDRHDELQKHLQHHQKQFEAGLLTIKGVLAQTDEAVLQVGNSQERTDEIVTILGQKLLALSALVEQHIARRG